MVTLATMHKGMVDEQLGMDMIVTFHGVRGSTPCQSTGVARYGGNTACVAIDAPGEDPLLFDLGTGLRYFGETLPDGELFRGTTLLSHLHWDHVQGLPFFAPLLREGASMDVYAPVQDDGRPAGEVLLETIRPPMFPVNLHELGGDLRFHQTEPDFGIGGYTVRSADVPHTGAMCGFRVSYGGRSVAYVCDHQQPADSDAVDKAVIELCADVDLLIHDAQFTPEEFASKQHWGHCTASYAVRVAAECGARQLALFHHDPGHDDAALDAIAAEAAELGAARGVDVFGAAEGIAIDLGAG
jgi:phosphoribosyl 1,2-cyclic phosphodiesterase